MPANSGWARVRSTWFQPMWGSVGASRDQRGATGEDAEGLGAVLVAALEQELEPEADPEVRPPGPDPVADRGREPASPQAVHRGARRPDARDDEEVRAANRLRVARDDDRGTDGDQRLVDAHEVAGAVVDDRDERAGRRRLTSSPSWTPLPGDAGPGRRRREARGRAP